MRCIDEDYTEEAEIEHYNSVFSAITFLCMHKDKGNYIYSLAKPDSCFLYMRVLLFKTKITKHLMMN